MSDTPPNEPTIPGTPPPPGPPTVPPGAMPPPPGGFAPPPAMAPPPGGYATTPSSGSNGLAIGGLVCGVIGLVTFWVCGLGAALGLVAVVLSVLGLNTAKKRADGSGRGLAIGGIVTGALALVLGIGFIVFVQFVANQTTTELENFNTDQFLDENLNSDELFPELNSDPPDGTCDPDRFIQDPDC